MFIDRLEVGHALSTPFFNNYQSSSKTAAGYQDQYHPGTTGEDQPHPWRQHKRNHALEVSIEIFDAQLLDDVDDFIASEGRRYPAWTSTHAPMSL